MKNFLFCRRTFVSTLCVLCLTALGFFKGVDVTMAIATIACALSGANAFEKVGAAKVEGKKLIGD